MKYMENELMIEEYKGLISDFEKIPPLPMGEPTFMEITKFPHYENVCSNVLSFYFDSEEKHGFKELLLQSLISCLTDGQDNIVSFPIRVTREVRTETENRIDLVIETPDLLIAIENKIWASLSNDLEDYSLYIANAAKDKTLKVLKIVLSIKSVEGLRAGFENVLYNDFFDAVSERIGDRLIETNSKYLLYWIDFTKTIKNLTKVEEVNPAVIDFFATNKEAISALVAQRAEIFNYLGRRAQSVKQMISINPEWKIRQWIWSKNYLVHDFTLPNQLVLAMDCVFDIDGIYVTLFVRKGLSSKIQKSEYLKKLSVYRELPMDGERIVLFKKDELPLSISNEEIGLKLLQLIKKLLNDADSTP